MALHDDEGGVAIHHQARQPVAGGVHQPVGVRQRICRQAKLLAQVQCAGQSFPQYFADRQLLLAEVQHPHPDTAMLVMPDAKPLSVDRLHGNDFTVFNAIIFAGDRTGKDPGVTAAEGSIAPFEENYFFHRSRRYTDLRTYLSAMRFLIIGQGLAGTLTGYRLERAGHDVHYVDAPEQTAASAVAAGIVNPITGRRFVKSWRIDELIPEAKAVYTELESLLGVRLWHEMPLIRTLYNRGDRNDWEVRSGDPGYQEYMDDQPDPGRVPELTEPVFAYAGVRHAARVDVSTLVSAFREKIVGEGRLIGEEFDYGQVKNLLGASAGAKDVNGAMFATYDYIICCEGWRARHNPWFAHLPHGGNKGEVLIVKTEAPLLKSMFKHRVFLVPLADDTYWIGATSENRFDDDAPTANNGEYLEDRLAEVLKVPYEIVGHRAAVRPTVRDRRMFIGVHPEEPRLTILNGLGTKGASLAPLGSRWLVEHLLEGEVIPEEVDIRRWG